MAQTIFMGSPPAASVLWAGKEVLVRITGHPDTPYTCRMTASGSYAWSAAYPTEDMTAAMMGFATASHTHEGQGAHTHGEGDVTSLVTDLSGKVGTGDSRLSDARTPTSHAHSSHSGIGANDHHVAFVQADHDALANPHHSNANDHANVLIVHGDAGHSALTYEASGAVATHAGLSDPHTGYRLESVAIAAADVAADVATQAELDTHAALATHHTRLHDPVQTLDHSFPGGTANFLRSDGTWSAPVASVTDPNQQSYTPGSFTLATGKYVILCGQMKWTTTQTVVAQGTSKIRVI